MKDSPIYHIIKAKIHKKQNNLDEALKTLNTAMQLPGMKRVGSAGGWDLIQNTGKKIY